MFSINLLFSLSSLALPLPSPSIASFSSFSSLQMCAEVDYIHRLPMKDSIYEKQPRRMTWTSSASSLNPSTKKSSWLERTFFLQLKRLFRRQSTSSSSISSSSAPLADPSPSPSIPDESIEEKDEDEDDEEKRCSCEPEPVSSPPPPSLTLARPLSPPIVDTLSDYDRLLRRCYERYESEREQIYRRYQDPISIPHADLIVSSSRSILINCRSYVKLFRSLGRRAELFQKYVNQRYHCQTLINERAHFILPLRTSQTNFDLILRKYLDDYVTCLTCQTAQTHLIRCQGQWRIECRLCGSQRRVERLK